MEIIIGLVALVIFAFGSYINHDRSVEEVKDIKNISETISPKTSEVDITTPEPTPKVKQETTVYVEPTTIATSAPIPSTGFIYPSSTVVENSGSRIKLITYDSPDKVTSWYQDKIKSEGMSATSFVKTSTNGNVLNKLVGAGSEMKVTIEITKHPGGNTQIIVTL